MQFKKQVPLIATRGYVSFPNTTSTIDVGRIDSIKAVDESLDKFDGYIFITSQNNPLKEDIILDELYREGSFAKISKKEIITTNFYRITVESLIRAKASRFIKPDTKDNKHKSVVANITKIKTLYDKNSDYEHVLFRKILKNFDQFLLIGGSKYLNNTNLAKDTIIKDYTPETFTDMLSSVLPLNILRQQMYIAERKLKERLKMILEDLTTEIEYLKIDSKIETEVREYFDATQREYYLKEKLRIIKEELGDKNIKDKEVNEFRKKLKKIKVNKVIKDKIIEEINRYEMIHQSSAECSIVKAYLDWMFAIPWGINKEDNYDLIRAKKILDKYHFGLKDVKNRILEFLAVKKLVNNTSGSIICLVGPPGVGKTSIAKSIAECLGRDYIKISLGGVNDEAEIRGHRRTYIGSMPGKIIQALKKSKSMNPVILLDEIDKVSNDVKGDPLSAILEVLDPEQNTKFSDHYIEEEVDLSKVMFIMTANYYEAIPEPLYDRMEIIDIGSYTEEEKLKIAKNFLIPKHYKTKGITESQLSLSEDVINIIIKKYAREAGVRGLDRQIAKIFRKTAKKIVEGYKESIKITNKNLHFYLGKPIFDFNKLEKENQIGVVSGLAYTSFGGDVLPVEVIIYPGNEKLVLTGKLGEVMKESATIALSYVKSQSKILKVKDNFFEKNTIHMHFPEGAIPKDGPSAGITMATAIISAITKRKVERTIGMTGEITLRGNILAIGGLKEKVMAAHRSGLKTIIIPEDNRKDISSIPKSIKKSLNILPVKNVKDAISVAISE